MKKLALAIFAVVSTVGFTGGRLGKLSLAAMMAFGLMVGGNFAVAKDGHPTSGRILTGTQTPYGECVQLGIGVNCTFLYGSWGHTWPYQITCTNRPIGNLQSETVCVSKDRRVPDWTSSCSTTGLDTRICPNYP